MPIVSLEISNAYDTVTRPIVVNLIRDLINRLNLPNSTRIEYTGNAETLVNKGSELSNKNPDPIFGFEGKVKVELDERYIEEGVLNTPVKRRDTTPVFLDSKLGVRLYPVYTKTEATVSFTYTTHSKGEAIRWRDSLRRMSTEGVMHSNLHEIIYSYGPPPIFLVILKEIHRLRENIAGYGESIEDYLKAHFQKRLTVKSNLKGIRNVLSIPEKQINVQGWYDFIAEPEAPQKEKDGDSWSVGFSYTLQYDKPTAMTLDYPVVVHNQLLDFKYVGTQELYNPYNQSRRGSVTALLMDKFSCINYENDYLYRGVRVPDYDDWKPEVVLKTIHPIITTLIGVELTDPYQIANLLELGDYDFTPEVLEFLTRHNTKLNRHLDNVFFVEFFRGSLPVDSSNIHIDSDLHVRSSVALDPRETYHLKVSIVFDLKLLTLQAKEDLLNDVDVCFACIDLIDRIQNGNDVIPSNRLVTLLEVLNDTRVTGTSFNKVLGRIKGNVAMAKLKLDWVVKTVMQAGIIAHRAN